MPSVRFALGLAAVAVLAGGAVVGTAELVAGTGETAVAAAPVARTTPALPARTIAFVSSRDGDFEIYAIRSDGTRLRQLTDNRARDYDPAWSPDGRRIAFVSDRDGDAEIFVMNADGSGVRQLTGNKVWDEAPAWSPDGRRIAYMSSDPSEREIYVMNADGSGERRLTRRRESWHDSITPSWSPDGREILFASNRAGPLNLEIYAMRPDGSSVRRLTRELGSPVSAVDDAMPAWSPDGRRIAFVSWRDGNSELYLMNADGSAPARVTRSTDSFEVRPRWSPDGRSLAYSSTSGTTATQVFLLDLDGMRERRLTAGWNPDWRPAG